MNEYNAYDSYGEDDFKPQKRKERPKNINSRGVKIWRIPDDEGNLPELKPKEAERLEKKALNYCLFMLGKGEQTRNQLRKKMIEKHCPENIADAALDILVKNNYLNDERYARIFAEEKRRYSYKGDFVIKRELKLKGIPDEIIEKVLDELTGENESKEDYDPDDIVRKLIATKIRSIMSAPEDKRLQRLSAFLIRRGHNSQISFRLAKEAIDEATRELNEE